jgi:hypothetical protein
MVELLLVMLVPTLVFGIFALLSVWLGAESRPWFDERPVLDDRPNWFPIARRVPDDDEDDDDEPHDGTPVPVPAPAPAQRSQRRPAAATSAATSPSGV